jgi:hypothetical protein
MTAAILEGYRGALAILTADKPDTTDELTAEQAAALLDELSRKMREAAAEVRPASFDLKGCTVTSEWMDESNEQHTP